MIVYKYGALKPKVIGGTFEEILAYQRDSNAFYNALIEIERWRIAARDIVEMAQAAPLDDKQKDEHRLAYNAACRAAGQATTIGWGQKQAVTEMVAAAMKTRRQDEFKARQRATKKGYDFVKRIMTCARPRHRRFDGEGMLAATVQGATALKSSSVLTKAGPVQISGDGKHRTVTLRLREGLSLEVPVNYHRPLPERAEKDGVPYDVRVIFARLMIDRIGDRWVYSVHLTIDAAPRAHIAQGGMGRCAVNFGWRRVEEGIRVAYAADDDGNEMSCVIPDSLIGRQKHAESLRSLADEYAVAYLGDAKPRTRARREALRDPSATHRELGQRRMTMEQASLQNPADREQWARRDRHLYQWERDEYASVLRSRREIYRLWARKLAASYDSVIIEAFDMRSVVVRAPSKDDIPAARHYRFLVGPHYLRAEIQSVFGKRCEILKPAKRTLTCHACGALCKWDKARELRHDCESCGAAWDQDANNSRNQLLDAAE
jgi:hypothetical protein